MCRIETIRISLSLGSRNLEGIGGIRTIADALASEPSMEWNCYRNPSVPEDILIVFRWGADSCGVGKSEIALALAREMKRQGLVDHTVWMSVDRY